MHWFESMTIESEEEEKTHRAEQYFFLFISHKYFIDVHAKIESASKAFVMLCDMMMFAFILN